MDRNRPTPSATAHQEAQFVPLLLSHPLKCSGKPHSFRKLVNFSFHTFSPGLPNCGAASAAARELKPLFISTGAMEEGEGQSEAQNCSKKKTRKPWQVRTAFLILFRSRINFYHFLPRRWKLSKKNYLILRFVRFLDCHID